MNKQIPLFIFFLFLLLSRTVLAENITPETCQSSLEGKRDLALRSLHRIENNYIQMIWNLKKSWETRYVVEWDALQKKKDEFSTERSSQGEILVERYQNQANLYQSLADENEKNLHDEIKIMVGEIETMSGICSAWAYQNCIRFPADKALTHLDALTTQLTLMKRTQKDLTKKIQKTLQDAPTEHVPYGNRLAPELEIWNVKYEPELFQIFRTIREQLEIELEKKECCNQCTEKNIAVVQNFQPNTLGTENIRGTQFSVGNKSGQAIGSSLMSRQTSVKEKKEELS